MSISFGGVGSGLPVNDWIEQLMQVERQPVDQLYTKKSDLQTAKTTLSTVASKFSSLRGAIERITDANLASSLNLFGRRTATSSDQDIVTASASNQSVPQKIKIKVDNLATSTKSQSLTNVAANATGSQQIVDLSNGNGTEGEFSLYVNGTKYEITAEHDDDPLLNVETLDDVARELKKISGITDAGVLAGKFFITTDASVTDLKFGSSGDTSNFWDVTQLSTVDTSSPESKTLSSLNALSAIDTGGTIAGAGATANLADVINTGTFTIGESIFTIEADTTFNDLISNINNDEDAGVVAHYDIRTNKLILTSKNPGDIAINLEDGSSNFLEKMGLITVAGNPLTSQTFGTNAKVYLNDSTDRKSVV